MSSARRTGDHRAHRNDGGRSDGTEFVSRSHCCRSDGPTLLSAAIGTHRGLKLEEQLGSRRMQAIGSWPRRRTRLQQTVTIVLANEAIMSESALSPMFEAAKSSHAGERAAPTRQLCLREQGRFRAGQGVKAVSSTPALLRRLSARTYLRAGAGPGAAPHANRSQPDRADHRQLCSKPGSSPGGRITIETRRRRPEHYGR